MEFSPADVMWQILKGPESMQAFTDKADTEKERKKERDWLENGCRKRNRQANTKLTASQTVNDK